MNCECGHTDGHKRSFFAIESKVSMSLCDVGGCWCLLINKYEVEVVGVDPQ